MAHWLLERLAEFGDDRAFVWRGRPSSYRELLEGVALWKQRLHQHGIASGACVALVGDFSPQACALLLALIDNRNVVVPLSPPPVADAPGSPFLDIASVDHVFADAGADRWEHQRRPSADRHPLFERLRDAGAPGLVLFSSGSAGKCKAALLDLERLLSKFRERRRRLTTLTFLRFDHIGGLNTLFAILGNGGTVVTLDARDPEAVCQAIARQRVQLLPTTPTFLKMLLISEAYRRHDLSSLELITYGTEPMPASTLEALNDRFPNVRFKQTYGLSELGILQTQSRNSDSLWLKVGGAGYETKVVDGVLWIRAASAMLGYLNAPSPFDADGWYNTHDAVAVDGAYLRILGRTTDIINVGGEKVYPAEVENVLLQIDNIQEAVVYGKPNPVTGAIVAATVRVLVPEEPAPVQRRIREHCRQRLAPFQVPMLIEVTGAKLHGERFKAMRRPGGAGEAA